MALNVRKTFLNFSLVDLVAMTNSTYMFFAFSDSQEALVYISEADIHAVAGTLKQYFRELPDPLFTEILYPKFIQVLGASIILLTTLCDFLCGATS